MDYPTLNNRLEPDTIISLTDNGIFAIHDQPESKFLSQMERARRSPVASAQHVGQQPIKADPLDMRTARTAGRSLRRELPANKGVVNV